MRYEDLVRKELWGGDGTPPQVMPKNFKDIA